MNNTIDRRVWLKQTALTIGGFAVGPDLLARGYHHQSPPDIIRLHANENPYGPSSAAQKAMAAAISSSNCYPWEITTALREKIASGYGLSKENILMGAGSSEILGLVAQLAALKKGNAVTADPTFGIWFSSAESSGLEIIKVPLSPDKKHDLQRMREKITESTRLVYVCNPNNPTGTVLPADELKEFITLISQKTLVLLDEAYIEYSGETTLAGLVKDNPNLVIAKTFSKIYGMAGARIGFALAHTDLIKKLNELQPWSNAGPSAVSLAGALASLGDNDFITASRAKNTAAREFVFQSFGKLGIPTIPSQTNFLFYSLKDQRQDLSALLAKNNIRAGRTGEGPEKWTRVSIGTMDQMKQFLELVKQSF